MQAQATPSALRVSDLPNCAACRLTYLIFTSSSVLRDCESSARFTRNPKMSDEPPQQTPQESTPPLEPPTTTNGNENMAEELIPPTQQPDMNGFVEPMDPSMMAAQMILPTMPLHTLPTTTDMSISADEIALYDRQIRLWGMKAQELIRGANVLLIGMKALGNEIAKNLVLAGVGTLTILDHELVTEDDLGAQFLVSEEDIGKNRAEAAAVQLRKMNPRVNLFTDTDILMSKLPEYFSTFHVTIATGLPFELLSSINVSCRMYGQKFYAADTHGMYGYVFADLMIHNFVIEKERGNISTKPMTKETSTRTVVSVATKRENDKIIEVVTKQEAYSPLLLANSSPLPADVTKTRRSKMRVTPLLSCLRALFDFQKESGGRLPAHNRADLQIFTKMANDRHLELQLPIETLKAEFLRSFIQNLGAELSPVVAFLGGHLAQDVINVLGQREQPLQNFLLFDGEEFKGPVYNLQPIFDESLAMPADENGSQVAPVTSDLINGSVAA